MQQRRQPPPRCGSTRQQPQGKQPRVPQRRDIEDDGDARLQDGRVDGGGRRCGGAVPVVTGVAPVAVTAAAAAAAAAIACDGGRGRRGRRGRRRVRGCRGGRRRWTGRVGSGTRTGHCLRLGGREIYYVSSLSVFPPASVGSKGIGGEVPREECELDGGRARAEDWRVAGGGVVRKDGGLGVGQKGTFGIEAAS